MYRSTIKLIVDSGPKKGETLDRKPGSLIRIGRVVRGNTLAIKDPSISQKHLIVEFDPHISRWVIKDLGTSNGTVVNGDLIPSSASFHLSDGDCIKIGESTFISVKILVFDENLEDDKRNVGRKGRARSKKVDDFEEILGLDGNEGDLGSSARVSSEAEILDSKDFERKRKGTSSTPSKENERLALENLQRRRRTCDTRVSKKEGIVESTVEEQAPDALQNGRKQSYKRDLKKDEILDVDVDVRVKAPPENLRTRSTSSNVVLKKGETSKRVVEERSEAVPENLRRTRSSSFTTVASKNDETLNRTVEERTEPAKNVVRGRREKLTVAPKNLGRRESSTRNLERNESLDSLTVDDKNAQLENLSRKEGGDSASVMTGECARQDAEVSMKVQKNVGGEQEHNLRRRRSSKYDVVQKKDETLYRVVGERSEAPPVNLRRTRSSSCIVASKNNETLHRAVEERTEEPKNVVRGRRGKLTDVPKNMGRGETSSACVLEKNESLDSFIGDDDDVRLEKKEGEYLICLMKDEHARQDVEVTAKALKNMGRARRPNLPRVPKKDDVVDSVLEDNIGAQRILGRGRRRTKSNMVMDMDDILDLVVEDEIKVPKNVGRGKRKADASRVSKADETLDSLGEGKIESSRNLGRRKMMTNSSNDSVGAENLDAAVGNNIQFVKNVEKGKPKRALARVTRASSRVLKEQELLQPAQLKFNASVLDPAENLCQLKDHREGSHQLDQLVAIQKAPLTTPKIADSKCKRRHNKEISKENHVKRQKTESKSKTMGDSSTKRIPCGEISVYENVAARCHVLPKVWNGNGIPNSTSKYREDQKVTFHATPFEERLEKALSDDKLFLQRKLIN